MIFPSDFEDKIGFSSIRNLLAEQCISPLGRSYVARMKFMTDFDDVRHALHLTHEMKRMLADASSMPAEGIYDITDSLRRLRVEGNFMTAKELYRLHRSISTMAALKRFLSIVDDGGELRAPLLAAEFASLESFPEIERMISSVLNNYGEIADNASPELFAIRRSISAASSSLSSVMRRVIDHAVAAGILDSDTSPAMRDGRLVIPVAAAHKRAIPGIVHDESATGKTSYIEPAQVVEASNRLRELNEQEKREIHKILVDTAARIRPHIPMLLESFEMLGFYEFIRAKALLAVRFDAELPIFEKRRELDWFGARHPQLALSLEEHGKRVVPLDLRLNSENRILIISGPNAGGKSVCLKTVGVVQYMLQCGMLPTMYANSHVCVFDNICIDIGDEQSLENDLSTYSSHLKNMKVFLRTASPSTLILVDEMGSGTEPQIGGALAQAIIMQFNEAAAMGVITTHYQNLKTFADNTPGIVNGAMLYDRQKMQPLFKLAIGSPGSSFAIEIAHKIGLPQSVIDEAKNIVGSDYVNMDKYLLDIARDRRYWQNKRQNIREKEVRLEQLFDRYDAQIEDLRRRRKEIIADAHSQAREILADTNRTVERTILEIRKAQAEKERTRELRKELDDYKRKVAATATADVAVDPLPHSPRRKPRQELRNVAPKSAPERKEITVGDYVRMTDGGAIGKVLSLSGNNAEVAFGVLRMRVPVKKLTEANAPVSTAATQVSSISRSTSEASRARQLKFKQDIDLRGMRADEALQAVTYFLDDAFQFGVSRVRILHGTGTGALRVAIRQYLQSVPGVTSFRDEDVRLGGAGITVVDLD